MRHTPNIMTFRMLQAVSDLRSVAATGFGELAPCVRPAHKARLRNVIFDQNGYFGESTPPGLREDLAGLASRPDVDPSTFLTATAVLLADHLQGGQGGLDPASHWNSYSEALRDGPSPIRAALIQGFRLACGATVIPDHALSDRELVTYDTKDLMRLLRRIAGSMTHETRDAVCSVAGDETASVHRHALDNCLSGSCILSEFGGWFPGEVVEKASLAPDHPGFVGCTALIVLDAIATRDAKGTMAFRWEQHAERYLKMAPEVRATILAGVRCLYEMPFDWQPYNTRSAVELIEKAVVVPFVKP